MNKIIIYNAYTLEGFSVMDKFLDNEDYFIYLIINNNCSKLELNKYIEENYDNKKNYEIFKIDFLSPNNLFHLFNNLIKEFDYIIYCNLKYFTSKNISDEKIYNQFDPFCKFNYYYVIGSMNILLESMKDLDFKLFIFLGPLSNNVIGNEKNMKENNKWPDIKDLNQLEKSYFISERLLWDFSIKNNIYCVSLLFENLLCLDYNNFNINLNSTDNNSIFFNKGNNLKKIIKNFWKNKNYYNIQMSIITNDDLYNAIILCFKNKILLNSRYPLSNININMKQYLEKINKMESSLIETKFENCNYMLRLLSLFYKNYNKIKKFDIKKKFIDRLRLKIILKGTYVYDEKIYDKLLDFTKDLINKGKSLKKLN